MNEQINKSNDPRCMIYSFQLAYRDKRVPAGHAISKNSVPDSKTERLGHPLNKGLLIMYYHLFLLPMK